VVFSGLLPAARGELVAGSGTLDEASHEPAPTDGQGRKHVLAGIAPNLRLRSGSVVRRPLGQTPDPGRHRSDIFGLSRLLGQARELPSVAGFRKRSGATIAGYWKASSPKSSEHPVPLIWATVDRNEWLELAT